MTYRFVYVSLAVIAGATDLLAAATVLAGAFDRQVARSFVAVALSMAGWCLGTALQSIPGDPTDRRLAIDLFTVGFLVLPAAAVHTATAWTGVLNTRMGRGLNAAAYGVAGFFCAAHLLGLVFSDFIQYDWGAVKHPGPLFVPFAIFAYLSVGLSASISFISFRRTPEGQRRLRIKYWLLGLGSFLPLASTNILANFGHPLPFPVGALGNVFLAALWAYAAIRHRLVEVDSFVARWTGSVLPGVAFTAPLATALFWFPGLSIGVFVFIVVVSLVLSAVVTILSSSHLRSYLEESVQALFPARKAAREAIRRLSKDLIHVSQHETLAQRVTATLRQGLDVVGVALYRVGKKGSYWLYHAEGDTQFPRDVTDADIDLLMDPCDGAWDACLPITLNNQPLGLLALSPKCSGAAIDDADRTLLAVLASQLGVAWTNIDYLEEIERQKAEIIELHHQAEAENVVLRAEVRSASQFREIVGASAALQHVLEQVASVGPTETSVLITGETGTGKELIARAIHDISRRHDGPLISINCPAIPANLAESDLFGHERGAFTGAMEAHPGKFELADGGTVFLDEVADLPLSVQVKLLRVLQEREIQRVGSNKLRKLDIRIVAATNRDLREEAAAGRFREDLYFRLAGVPLHVPALRERVEDIPALATFFLQRAATQYQKEIEGFSPEAMTALLHYNWPGNIRELQHVVERAVLLCAVNRIRPEHLSDLAPAPRSRPRSTLSATLRAEKVRRVEEALTRAGGNQAAAARLLGMSRSNFGRLLRALGLKPASSLQ
ncbi:MAG: sigma 54-interacting transcriptional regulator [Deltaproteobacteria bacterium]|nr:sigma 54-interacting transcriptional regulator [Deltaproteobacteria bacterium]